MTETSLNWDANVGEQILFERDANFFSLENVKKVMLEVKPKTCYGYDNIPVRVLLDGIDYLIKPFHKLLNMIYIQKIVPDQCKTSQITPLHKK